MTKREQFINLYSQYKAKGSEYNIPMQLSLCRLFEDLFSAEVVFNTLTDIKVETHDKINKNYMLADIVDILRIHFSIVNDADMLVTVEHRLIGNITVDEFDEFLMGIVPNSSREDYTFFIPMQQREMVMATFLHDKIAVKYDDSSAITVYSLEQFSSLIQILNQI